MTEFLKGNFLTKNTVSETEQSSTSLEEQFEMEALKKLGGSIAFVSKKKVMWDDDDVDSND